MKQLGELGEIKLVDIEIRERQRESYGDVTGLAKSIQERGLICPIAVSKQEVEGKPPYKLEAGGRRMAAHILLGRSEIKCRIFPKSLTVLESKLIELEENVRRLDLSYAERDKAVKEIDDLMKEEFGEKVSTSPDAPGHSQRDTASLMNLSAATVTRSLKLASAYENFPDLELDKCKDQNEAMKKLDTFQKMIVRGEVARQAESQLGSDKEKLYKSYIVQDVLEGMKKLPDESFNVIEVDPPYAIALESMKKGNYNATYLETYNEAAPEEYEKFLELLFTECYRVASKDSWLLCWFAPEPWAEVFYQAITKAGFRTRRLTAFWSKPSGQTRTPRYYLANCSENFYYCRKGDPQIIKQGRVNEFSFPTVSPQNKIHPTERPLSLMLEVLSTFAIAGSRVLVPFAGSGVTLKAAWDLRMIAVGFDLSEDYRNAFVTKAQKEVWE